MELKWRSEFFNYGFSYGVVLEMHHRPGRSPIRRAVLKHIGPRKTDTGLLEAEMKAWLLRRVRRKIKRYSR